jgi:type II secretion system protein L
MMALDGTKVDLLIPGSRVVTHKQRILPKELPHLREMAPYLVEDEFATDVETLHFAYGSAQVEGDEVDVAMVAVARPWLRAHYDVINAAGLEVMSCKAEPLVLPYSEGTWTLLWRDGLHVRLDRDSGFSVSEALLPYMQSALGKRAGEYHSGLQPVMLLGDFPKPFLPDNTEVTRTVEHWQYPLGDSIDLAQGEFVRRLPLRQWWGHWQSSIILLLIACVVYTLVSVSNIVALKAQQQAVQSQIVTLFRQVVPKGALVDPERQLRQRLGSMSQTARKSSALIMLERVTPLIAAASGVQVKSMNYNDERHELRLQLQADSFNLIEQLRAKLELQGMTATLMNSSVSKGKHRARLQIFI